MEKQWRACEVLKTFERFYDGAMTNVTVAGETIQATSLHPFWVVRGEALAYRPRRPHLPPVPADATMPGRWVDAADLCAGDELLLRDGRICRVEEVEHFHFQGMVYNFHVEFLECYAVGLNSVLVHNNNGPMSRIVQIMSRRLDNVRTGINFGARVARAFRNGTAGQYFPLLGRFAETVAATIVENFPAITNVAGGIRVGYTILICFCARQHALPS